jgi:hypothetical protein
MITQAMLEFIFALFGIVVVSSVAALTFITVACISRWAAAFYFVAVVIIAIVVIP